MSDRTALTDIVPPVRQEPQHNQSISSRRSRYFLATSVTKKLDHNRWTADVFPDIRMKLEKCYKDIIPEREETAYEAD